MLINQKSTTKFNKDGSPHKRIKTIYTLKCDQCLHIFTTNDRQKVFGKNNDKEYHFCCTKCSNEAFKKGGLSNEKFKKTNLEKYGVENPSQISEIQEKMKATLIKNYGVECTFHSPEIIEKIKKTNIERYGVENVFEIPGIQDKIKKTNLEKYRVEFVGQSREFHDKRKITNLEKYGFSTPLLNEEVKEKTKKTNLENYGVENVFASKEIQAQIKQDNLEKYGVEFVGQRPEVKEKSVATNLETYGVKNVFSSPIIQEQIKQINIKKYGVPYITQVEDQKIKSKKTRFEKYGFEHYAQTQEFKDNMDYKAAAAKAHQTRKTNDSYGKSKEEDRIYEILIKTFGSDIERQKRINNWSIDFYVSSINLYINYNGSYYHGLDRSIEDIMKFATKQDEVIYQTYLRDLQRLEYFASHHIPYLVLSDPDLKNSDPETHLLNKIFSYLRDNYQKFL